MGRLWSELSASLRGSSPVRDTWVGILHLQMALGSVEANAGGQIEICQMSLRRGMRDVVSEPSEGCNPLSSAAEASRSIACFGYVWLIALSW